MLINLLIPYVSAIFLGTQIYIHNKITIEWVKWLNCVAAMVNVVIILNQIAFNMMKIGGVFK